MFIIFLIYSFTFFFLGDEHVVLPLPRGARHFFLRIFIWMFPFLSYSYVFVVNNKAVAAEKGKRPLIPKNSVISLDDLLAEKIGVEQLINRAIRTVVIYAQKSAKVNSSTLVIFPSPPPI